MSRRSPLLALVAALTLAAACTATVSPDGERAATRSPAPSASTTPDPEPEPEAPTVHTAEPAVPDEPATVLAVDDPAAAAVAVSEAAFDSAPVVVLAPADDVPALLAAASHAVTLGAPLLLTAPVETDVADERAGSASAKADDDVRDDDRGATADDDVAAEVERLGALAVLTVGEVGDGAVPDDVRAVRAPEDVADLERLLRVELSTTAVPKGRALAAVAALDPAAPTVLIREPDPDAGDDPGTGDGDREGDAGKRDASAEAGGGDATASDDEADEGERAVENDGNGEPAATDTAPAYERPNGPVPPALRPSPSSTDDDTPAETEDDGLPLTEPVRAPEPITLLVTGVRADIAPVATARAAGWDVVVVPDGDPRTTSATVQALAEAAPERTVAVGRAFGDDDELAWKVRTAATGVELPGGGQVLFPHRRMVALYGTPSTAALGLLGEQGLPESIARAQGLAAEYQALTDDLVVPAFEIIVTIASAGAGADGQYSQRLPVESFVPWVEAARDAGVYVVIDLQPGRTDFLTQAQAYEQLLRYPNVGLALDPEWRLKPDQVHLRQIGSVGVDEVNQVVHWLADLTREHDLPQKLLVLHQFRLSMISERERLDTSRDELALMIHVDGQGSQPAKQDTWRALRNGAPDVWWGWKNFIDEDTPMLTPAQTYEQVDPVPQLVTYQ